MFKVYDTDSTNMFNEILKAGTWTGSTNVLFGYGRDSFAASDANALSTYKTFDQKTLPVGFFDGLNTVNGERTHGNNNYYNIFDLSGNVDEWVNGPPRPGTPDARSVCGGSFSSLIQPLESERIIHPYSCGDFGGFRPVTTFMPDEYLLVNILFCFHVPPQEEEIKDEKKEPHTQQGDQLPERKPDTVSHPFTPPQHGGLQRENTPISPEPVSPGAPGQTPGGGGHHPRVPPDTPPAPHPYTLDVSSEHPASGVGISINTPDINGHTDGETFFTRFYIPGANVSATAPDLTGNNQFQYWERNGSPSTLNQRIDIQMLSNQEITAVYLGFPPPTSYTLNVNSTPANGVPITISRNDNNGENNGNTAFSREYNAGQDVTATAPDSFNGLQFREWLLNGRPVTSDQSVTVVMQGNTTLTAAYGPRQPGKQLIVNSINPDSGVPISVSIPDNNGLQDGSTSFMRNYDTGEEITLVAPSITNKVFQHWLRNGVIFTTSETVTFELQTDLTMTAVYKDFIPNVILSVHSDNPDNGVNIEIGTPDLDGHTDGTTSFTRRYDIGTPTTVTAPPTAPNGNGFVQWIMNGAPLSTNLNISVNMLTDTDLIAVYRPDIVNTFDLIVQSENPDSGVPISVTLPDINNNTDGSTTFTRTYEEGATTRLTAPETAEGGTRTFNYWLIDGSRYDSRTIDVAMFADHTVTAVYKDTPPDLRYILTVQSRNPNSSVVITIDPADVNGQQNGSTTFTRLYNDGEHVTLTASNPAFPGSSNSFKYWEIDGTPWSTDETVSVDMTRDITVTAVYGNIDTKPHTLSVESLGPDNGVDIAISQVDTNGLSNGHTDFERTYLHGTDLTATAPDITTDSNGSKFEFQHWLLDGVIYTDANSIDLSILGDMTITAVYEPYNEHTLTVDSRNPDSGVDITVSTIDNNGNQDGSTSFDRIYPHAENVSLEAPSTAPNGRDIFRGWERDGSIISTNTTIDVTMYTDITVTAIYGPPDTFDLTVRSENPDKHVDVSISTPDINGDTDGETEFIRTYNPGESTTLTAVPTAEGNNFIEWRRNGIAVSTNLSITVNMLSDVEMTAVYGAPNDNRRLDIRSVNPDSGVIINIDLPDQRGETDGETAFSRLYHDGDTVTATAPPNAGGNVFRQWFLDGTPFSTNQTITVQMWNNHEITAEYGPGTPIELSLYVDSINPNSGVPITVSTPDNNGLQDGDTVFVRTYTYGDTTTLTAPAQGGTNNTSFSHWERDGVHYSDNRSVDIEMLTDVYMTAVYNDIPPPVNLTVTAKKDDGTALSAIIGVAPADLNGEAVGTTGFRRTYNYGTSATLDAPETVDGEPFLHWERNGTPLSTNRTVDVELLTDVTMTAVYGRGGPAEEVILTVESEGPLGPLSTFITTTPDNNADAGGTTTYQRRYNSGTDIMLTAPDTDGSLIFDYWELNGAPYTQPGTGVTTIPLTMLSDNTLKAVYINDQTHIGEL